MGLNDHSVVIHTTTIVENNSTDVFWAGTYLFDSANSAPHLSHVLDAIRSPTMHL